MNPLSNLTSIPDNYAVSPRRNEDNTHSEENTQFRETPESTNFSTLFQLGIIDEDGKLTPQFENRQLPRLEKLFSEELNALLQSPVTTGTNITLENLLKHVVDGTNAPVKIEIVGGFLRRLILSHPEVIQDALKDIVDVSQLIIPSAVYNVPDCDIRCTFMGISDKNTCELTRRMFDHVKDDMGESYNEEYVIAKKKLFHSDDYNKLDDNNKKLGDYNKFGIITFKGPANLDYEILIIKTLKRKSLFIHDACRLIVNSLLEKTKGNVLLVSDYGLQPVIDLLTKIVHINKVEDIDHLGWPMLISYYTRGFTSTDKQAEGTLIKKSLKFNLYELLQHCVKNHHKNDHAAELAFLFNASVSLGLEKVLIRTLWDKVSSNQSLPNEDLLWGIKKLLTEERISFELLVNCIQIFALLHLNYPNHTVNLVQHHKEKWIQIRIGNNHLLIPFNIEKALECITDEKSHSIFCLLHRIWAPNFDKTGSSQFQKYRNLLNIEIDKIKNQALEAPLPLSIILHSLQPDVESLVHICNRLPEDIESPIQCQLLSILGHIFPLYASLFSKAQELPILEFRQGWILLLAETQDPVLCKISYQMFSKSKGNFSDCYLFSFIQKLLPQDPFSAFYVFRKLETFDESLFNKILNAFKSSPEGKIFLDSSGKEAIRECLHKALSKDIPITVQSTTISLLKTYVDDPEIWKKVFHQLSESNEKELRLLALPLLFEYGTGCGSYCWYKTLQTAAQHKSNVVYGFIDKILEKDSKEQKLFNDSVTSTEVKIKILHELVFLCLDRLPSNNTKTNYGVRIFALRNLIDQAGPENPKIELDIRIIETLLKVGHPDGVSIITALVVSRFEELKVQPRIDKLLTIMIQTCDLLLKDTKLYDNFRQQYQYNQHLMTGDARRDTRLFLDFLGNIKEIKSDPAHQENPLVAKLIDKAMPLFIDFGTYDKKCYSFQMLESDQKHAKYWERFIETRLRMTLVRMEPIIHRNELIFFKDNLDKLPKESEIRTKCMQCAMTHFCEFLLNEYNLLEDQSMIPNFMKIFKEDDNNLVFLITELINSDPSTPEKSELFCSRITVDLLYLKMNKKIPEQVLNKLFDNFIYMACHSPSVDEQVLLKNVITVIQKSIEKRLFSFDRIVKWIFFHTLKHKNYISEDLFNKHCNDAISELFLDFLAINRIEFLPFTLRLFVSIQKYLFKTGYSKLKQGYQYYIKIFTENPHFFQTFTELVNAIEDALSELKQIAKDEKKMTYYSRIESEWRAIPR